MGWLIIGIILLLIGTASTIAFVKIRSELKEALAPAKQPEPAMAGRGGTYYDIPSQSTKSQTKIDNLYTDKNIALVGAILAFLFGAVSSFGGFITIVPAKSVGIPVTYGQVGSPLGSGPHLVSPVTDVKIISTANVNINLDTDANQWANGVCTAVLVRLASGASACVDITVQWNVEDSGAAASKLWSKYQGGGEDFINTITKNVVERDLQGPMNNQFANYNPIVVGNDNQAVNTPLDLVAFSQQVKDALIKNMEPGVQIDEFIIPHVHFDTTTQNKINSLAQAKADTQIAMQQKLTAEQQKEANDLLAAASSSDPGVEYQNCLNLIQKLATAGQLNQLPPTFNCSQAGSGTPVIVQAK